MRKIGYRVKLFENWADEFYKQYGFDVVEIKVNESFFKYADFRELERLRSYLKNALSFHIPKKAFYEDTDFEMTQKFIQRYLNPMDDCILVTHFMYGVPYNEKYMAKLSYSEVAWHIALENVEMCGDLLGYLASIKLLAKKYGFKVCLDVGHLFYSAFKSNVTTRELLNFFDKDAWWRANIAEFHIHDYDEERCHLNLGSGIMCWEDLVKLFNILIPFNNIGQSFIIETTVEDITLQGVHEVFFLRERIKRYENF